MKNIYSVDSVKIYEMSDGSWGIDADGQVSTGGWKRPALVSHSGIINPNGDLEYDFLAEPPTGFVTQAFADISAHGKFGGPGTDITGLKRIVVHGSKGSAAADFDG